MMSKAFKVDNITFTSILTCFDFQNKKHSFLLKERYFLTCKILLVTIMLVLLQQGLALL